MKSLNENSNPFYYPHCRLAHQVYYMHANSSSVLALVKGRQTSIVDPNLLLPPRNTFLVTTTVYRSSELLHFYCNLVILQVQHYIV